MDAWMWPLKDQRELAKEVEQPILFINMEAFQTEPNLRAMKRFTVDADHTERRVVTLKYVSIYSLSIGRLTCSGDVMCTRRVFAFCSLFCSGPITSSEGVSTRTKLTCLFSSRLIYDG